MATARAGLGVASAAAASAGGRGALSGRRAFLKGRASGSGGGAAPDPIWCVCFAGSASSGSSLSSTCGGCKAAGARSGASGQRGGKRSSGLYEARAPKALSQHLADPALRLVMRARGGAPAGRRLRAAPAELRRARRSPCACAEAGRCRQLRSQPARRRPARPPWRRAAARQPPPRAALRRRGARASARPEAQATRQAPLLQRPRGSPRGPRGPQPQRQHARRGPGARAEAEAWWRAAALRGARTRRLDGSETARRRARPSEACPAGRAATARAQRAQGRSAC